MWGFILLEIAKLMWEPDGKEGLLNKMWQLIFTQPEGQGANPRIENKEGAQQDKRYNKTLHMDIPWPEPLDDHNYCPLHDRCCKL